MAQFFETVPAEGTTCSGHEVASPGNCRWSNLVIRSVRNIIQVGRDRLKCVIPYLNCCSLLVFSCASKEISQLSTCVPSVYQTITVMADESHPDLLRTYASVDGIRYPP